MAGTDLSRDDLRSAVAAGLISEAQAAGVIAHADARAGRRALMTGEDEPFELFRGFADIFVAVGLILLLTGAMALFRVVSFGGLVPAGLAATCWVLARYFTLKRRMTLPSIVLVTGFAIGAGYALALLWSLVVNGDVGDPETALPVGIALIGALLLHYRTFKVPFTLFLVGLVALAIVLAVTDSLLPDPAEGGGIYRALDLRQGSAFAVGTFVFGVGAFVGGMWFDMRDPHRLGRWSASGFWLHLLAAPALVNTAVMTVYNLGGTSGNLLTVLALVGVAGLALIIDRRSFLTAGIGYLGLVVSWAIRSGTGDLSPALLLLVLGGLVTSLGTWWVPLRVWLMTNLPDFPGKSRLPPYGMTQ